MAEERGKIDDSGLNEEDKYVPLLLRLPRVAYLRPVAKVRRRYSWPGRLRPSWRAQGTSRTLRGSLERLSLSFPAPAISPENPRTFPIVRRSPAVKPLPATDNVRADPSAPLEFPRPRHDSHADARDRSTELRHLRKGTVDPEARQSRQGRRAEGPGFASGQSL